MTAAVEINADGTANAAYARTPAWHRLGTVVEEGLSTDEFLASANMAGWDVQKTPIENPYGDEDLNRYFVTRLNPVTKEREIMGAGDGPAAIVGTDYTVVQIEDAFAFAQNIVHGGGSWEAGVSLHNGRVVFGTLALPNEEIVIDPDGAGDSLFVYMTIATSFDGSTPTVVKPSVIRPECANMLAMVLGAKTVEYKIKHTSNLAGRVIDARESLKLTLKAAEKVKTDAEMMYQTPMTSGQFMDALNLLWKRPETTEIDGKVKGKAALTRWENKVDLVGDLFSGGGDVKFSNENIRGTAWAGYNAVIEYLDWHRSVRGDDDNLLIAGAGFDRSITNQKSDVLDVFKGWARDNRKVLIPA